MIHHLYSISKHFLVFQVHGAIDMNQTKKQWVDLGVLQEPCLTRPETSGAAGGAVSVWVKKDFMEHRQPTNHLVISREHHGIPVVL